MTKRSWSRKSIVQVKAASETARWALQAASEGRHECLQVFDGKTLAGYRCLSGCTVLHWAAGNNQLCTIRYLVCERNMDVNIPATKKAMGRTPLHYACRNGSFEAVRLLLELGAHADARAKHGVSPFQLAVWQNQLDICRYLVEEHSVDPAQLNEFDCGAVHWIGLCPPSAADGIEKQGELLLPMAKWLATLHAIDFTIRQRQGHSPFHKAAWGAHIALLRWLRDEFGVVDNTPDHAGNYAVDLAEMANDERHSEVANWLRRECSPDRIKSCSILGVGVDADMDLIRRAYLAKAKRLHPDRNNDVTMGEVTFDEIREAYEHLTSDAGIGYQKNPSHSIKLMLKLTSTSPEGLRVMHDGFFKARLAAVLMEYGDQGLDLSNVRRKWTQVWPDTPCPWDFAEINKGRPRRKGVLLDFIRQNASDIVDIVFPTTQTGSTVIKLRSTSQAQDVKKASMDA